MTSKPEINPLPDDLVRALADLGGQKAPAELDHRVALAVFGAAEAPDALWARVAPAVREQGEQRRRRARILSYRRVLTAAAAVLLVSIGVGLYGPGGDPGLDAADLRQSYEAHKAEVLSQIILIESDPSEMSPIARDLGARMGGSR